MNTQPNEIIYLILNKISTFDQIRILSIVCKRWYLIIKDQHKKILCNNFEDFILNDHIQLYPTYKYIFDQSIYFLSSVSEPDSNLYKLIDKVYCYKKIDDDLLLTWIMANGYIMCMKKMCQRMDMNKFLNLQNNYRVVFAAITNSHSDIVKYVCDNYDLAENNATYFELSGECDNIELVDYFYHKINNVKQPQLKYFLNRSCFNIIEYFFKCGELKNINLNKFGQTNFSEEFFILLYPLLEKYDDHYSPIDLKIIKAIIDNDLQLIIKIFSEGYDLDLLNNFMIIAGKLNRLNIIKYICNNCNPDGDLINNLFSSELYSKHLDIITYLCKKYPMLISKNILNYTILKVAIYANNIDLVKFLFDNGFMLDEFDISELYVPDCNILPILKYMHNFHPKVKLYHRTTLRVISNFGDQSDLDFFQIKYVRYVDYKYYLRIAIINKNDQIIKILHTLISKSV